MSEQHGGPAFPVDSQTGNMEEWRMGMSLRDYFAGQALIAICYADGLPKGLPEWIAASAYEISDAMLKEREK